MKIIVGVRKNLEILNLIVLNCFQIVCFPHYRIDRRFSTT